MAEIVGLVIGAVQFVAQCLSPSVGRRINRWREFESNFQNLKKEVETLKVKTRSIQREVDAAKKKGDGIEENVQKWMERGEELEKNFQKWHKRASKFIGDDKATGKTRKDEQTEAAVAAGENGGHVQTAAMVGEITEETETTAVTEAAGEIREDEETEAAEKRCFNGVCPDLKARYQLSKEAETFLEAVVKHLEAGKFDKISYPIIPKDPRLSNKHYEAFE